MVTLTAVAVTAYVLTECLRYNQSTLLKIASDQEIFSQQKNGSNGLVSIELTGLVCVSSLRSSWPQLWYQLIYSVISEIRP